MSIVFDGIEYDDGSQLPNLGSWVDKNPNGNERDYKGLSHSPQ